VWQVDVGLGVVAEGELEDAHSSHFAQGTYRLHLLKSIRSCVRSIWSHTLRRTNCATVLTGASELKSSTPSCGKANHNCYFARATTRRKTDLLRSRIKVVPDF